MQITNDVIEDVIAVEREAHKCNERLINGTVSSFCAGCHHYYANDGYCSIRDDVIQGMQEDNQRADLDI